MRHEAMLASLTEPWLWWPGWTDELPPASSDINATNGTATHELSHRSLLPVTVVLTVLVLALLVFDILTRGDFYCLATDRSMTSRSCLVTGRSTSGASPSLAILIGCVAASSMTGDLYFAMLAPFFPELAVDRGASSLSVGLIFAAHPAALLATSPFVPSMLRHFDSYAMLRRALLLQACFCAAFAQLDALDQTNAFVGGAIVMRALQGASNAVVEITGEALVLSAVPVSALPSALGTIGGVRALGLLGGPALGGVLYDAGGFELPFAACACLFCALAAAVRLGRGATRTKPPQPPPPII